MTAPVREDQEAFEPAAAKKLLDSAASGDQEAIAMLLEHHLPQLQAFIRLRMGPGLRAKESAMDLAQSACKDVLENMHRYQHRGDSNFRRWLFTAAVRKVADRAEYYQAEKRDMHREVPVQTDDLNLIGKACQTFLTPSRDAQGKEHLKLLEAAFDKLPEHYREVILLSRVVGLSHREIAEIMGRSESATRNLLYRALADLGQTLS